LARIR